MILYQFNVAQMRASFDDPALDDFRLWADAIRALAEKSRGFVRRFRGEERTLGYVRADPDDPLLMGNLSSWESLDDLYAFVNSPPHKHMMNRSSEWFEPHEVGVPHVVYWWQKRKAEPPTITQAMARLDLLRRKGSTPEAFGPVEAGAEPRS